MGPVPVYTVGTVPTVYLTSFLSTEYYATMAKVQQRVALLHYIVNTVRCPLHVFGYKKTPKEKEVTGCYANFCGNIWKFRIKFVSLQRQNESSGYPGRIPRGVRLYRYCPF